MFVSGLPLIIGPRKTFYFFARRNKLRGCTFYFLPSLSLKSMADEREDVCVCVFVAVSFLGGIVLVFLKYPFFGVLIETFGFLNLFGYVLFPLQPLIYLERS